MQLNQVKEITDSDLREKMSTESVPKTKSKLRADALEFKPTHPFSLLSKATKPSPAENHSEEHILDENEDLEQEDVYFYGTPVSWHELFTTFVRQMKLSFFVIFCHFLSFFVIFCHFFVNWHSLLFIYQGSFLKEDNSGPQISHKTSDPKLPSQTFVLQMQDKRSWAEVAKAGVRFSNFQSFFLLTRLLHVQFVICSRLFDIILYNSCVLCV